jgi:hypothetical protein
MLSAVDTHRARLTDAV